MGLKTAIVNVSVGANYPKGQARLADSLRQHGFDGEFICWTECYPPFSPPHDRVPYGFKCFALQEARRRGVELALWLDASMFAIKPIDPIFDYIAEHKVAVWKAGWSVGEWTTDAALIRLGLSRDEAMKIPLVCGGICGFDFRDSAANEMLDQWADFARDGKTFPGPWKNTEGNCSADPRCKGHRHDMPPLSVLTLRHNFESIDCPKFFAYWSDPAPAESLILARGM